MTVPVSRFAVDGAQAWAESMVASPDHDRLAVRFAPSTLASLELLPEGRRFYPRIVEDIAAAQHSVHVIQYGFKPGHVADSFLPVLAERAAAGVQVRMILDAVGSAVSGVSKQMLDRPVRGRGPDHRARRDAAAAHRNHR